MTDERDRPMRPPCPLLLSLGMLLIAVVPAAADDLLPADRPLPEVIDHYIGAHLREAEITPARAVTDAHLIRRTTLDLAGRIPTAAEVQTFVESSDADKRTQLVDRLLGSPDFDLHQRNALDALLMPDGRSDGDFRDYLLRAVQENRPWDRMFREMILGGDDESAKGATAFLRRRVRSLDDMTNDVSRLFFGVSINCAQCHDHPLVDDWKQDHYFGFQTFFSRTYLTKKNTLAEKSLGEVKFKTTKGEEKPAAFMFLTGATVEEPEREWTKEELKAEDEAVRLQMKDEKAPPPTPPAFSPRTEFVRLALAPENRNYFSRSIVNRLWARLLGRGLVDPLDQMHSANEPTHPDLLAWLARDMEQHDYDLKRLIRGIVLSRAYARAGRWSAEGGAADDDDAPWDGHFAYFMARPLTPRQYALSLVIASRNPQEFAREWTADDWRKRRQQLENESNGYAGQFEQPTPTFQVSVDEALFFSNNDRIQNDLLRDSADRLVGHLKTLPDRPQQITAAFRATLSREPAPEELTAFDEYLTDRADRPVPALQQAVWALLTSPELRFNY